MPLDEIAHTSNESSVISRICRNSENSEKERAERGNWSGRFESLIALLGYSVGLGNIWRFPYIAYSNGGGAFLLPFILMLVLIGIPLLFLELAIGQFSSRGPASIFDRICPLFNGLGYAMISVSVMVTVYYTVIISWCILYLFKSFTAELPWESCHEEWATDLCYSSDDAAYCKKLNGSVYFGQTCYNSSLVEQLDIKSLIKNETNRHTPAEEYFERKILNISDGMDNMGNPQWEIVLCLFFAWAMTFAALCRGVKSTGKAVYVSTLFPYVILLILFVRGVTLPGASEGIMYYITPRFDKLLEAKVWSDAAVQIFYALTPAFGGMITLSSYNKFHNNFYKDTLIVGIGNISTSLFAGLVIFAIIGYLANELDMGIEEVVQQGPGLAFIVFPDVVTRLPISPLWSILFFSMISALGAGSQFGLMEVVMTAILDTYPSLRNKKIWVLLTICTLGFTIGLPLTCRGGLYLVQLMDNYSASWSIFIMATIESIIIGWIYGGEKFIRDIETMIGRRNTTFHIFFKLFWGILTPVILMFVLVFNFVQYSPLKYDDYVFPTWANLIGIMLSITPLLIISVMAVKRLRNGNQDLTAWESLKFLLKPTAEWGPSNDESTKDTDNNTEIHEPHVFSRKRAEFKPFDDFI